MSIFLFYKRLGNCQYLYLFNSYSIHIIWVRCRGFYKESVKMIIFVAIRSWVGYLDKLNPQSFTIIRHGEWGKDLIRWVTKLFTFCQTALRGHLQKFLLNLTSLISDKIKPTEAALSCMVGFSDCRTALSLKVTGFIVLDPHCWCK